MMTAPSDDRRARAAIVLCGGQSTRMGMAKALLPFGPETLLTRAVRTVAAAVEVVVVVAAAGQMLPPLPDGTQIAFDNRPGRGPLEGLAAGLAKLPESVEAAFVTSCDMPFVSRQFVDATFRRLQHHQIAVPRDGDFHHPLAAVYRRDVLPHVLQLLSADRLRAAYLFDEVDTVEIPVEELRGVDPELRSLMNVNRPEDYLHALELAGFAADPEILKSFTPNSE